LAGIGAGVKTEWKVITTEQAGKFALWVGNNIEITKEILGRLERNEVINTGSMEYRKAKE
jgi:hypothetical protein